MTLSQRLKNRKIFILCYHIQAQINCLTAKVVTNYPNNVLESEKIASCGTASAPCDSKTTFGIKRKNFCKRIKIQ